MDDLRILAATWFEIGTRANPKPGWCDRCQRGHPSYDLVVDREGWLVARWTAVVSPSPGQWQCVVGVLARAQVGTGSVGIASSRLCGGCGSIWSWMVAATGGGRRSAVWGSLMSISDHARWSAWVGAVQEWEGVASRSWTSGQWPCKEGYMVGSLASSVMAGVGGVLRPCGWRGMMRREVLVKLSLAVATWSWSRSGIPIPVW